MSRYRINLVVFLAGLAVVVWIGAGYVTSNPLALAVTLLVCAGYAVGALELYRYQQTTAALGDAVNGLSDTPPSLAAWLERVPAGLRNAVRLRVEGERVALTGPALTPYLVGMLVLLGMLGTLLGMVATLRGTGVALESATDLDAIRASLAAPVKGLGFAFGTSIAGVATSAMLGLLSALCRRERIQVAQALDGKIATSLRIFSQTYQREESFKLLQKQADVMPNLVDRLHAMMAAIEQQSVVANERQLAGQQAFHGNTEAVYTRLAASVEQSLKQSLAESARVAGAALQPVVEATMAGLSRETTALHASVTHAVERQLDGLTTGFASTTTEVNGLWRQALADHQRSSEALSTHLRDTLDRFTGTFEQRSTTLLDGVATRLDATAGQVSEAWNLALSRQEQAGEKLAAQNEQALVAAAATFEQHSASLLSGLEQTLSRQEQTGEKLAGQNEQALTAAAARFEQHSASLLTGLDQALTRQQQTGDTLASQNEQALAAAAATFEQHAASLLSGLSQSHADLQTELASRDQARLTVWTDTLGAIATNLKQDWEQTGERTATRQQMICETLERTAHDITAQTQAHAAETIREIAQLVQAASEAPKAAAEVVAELRQKLSDSMARDTAMLAERSRMLETLETLLDAVNHASTQQRSAVDALVATSADLLERVGTRFTDKVEAETGKLGDIAAHVTGSAVEVASLGEAFGAAVHVFGDSNDKLVAHLQRIETALDKSLTRSDEQLAYYVAQAREVIDLSVMSQKQIIENLQQLAAQRKSAGAETA